MNGIGALENRGPTRSSPSVPCHQKGGVCDLEAAVLSHQIGAHTLASAPQMPRHSTPPSPGACVDTQLEHMPTAAHAPLAPGYCSSASDFPRGTPVAKGGLCRSPPACV